MPRAGRLALLASLATLLIATPAGATPVAPKGKVRVSLDTEFLSWQRAALGGFLSLRGNGHRTHVIGFGPGRPATVDGLGTPGGSVIALGVGYGVHKHLVLGARFGMNLTHTLARTGDPADERNDDDRTTFVGSFTPYLEILPRAEGRVLPFILVRTGFVGSRTRDRNGVFWDYSASIAPQVGVGVGAHAFVTRAFSIDFGLTFDYRWHFGRLRTGGGPGDPGYPGPWSRNQRSFILAATLGLSTWF